jgi:hypothetical protein
MARELVEKGGVGDVVHEEAVLAVVEYVDTLPTTTRGFWAEWVRRNLRSGSFHRTSASLALLWRSRVTFSDVEHAHRQEVRARDYLSAIE